MANTEMLTAGFLFASRPIESGNKLYILGQCLMMHVKEMMDVFFGEDNLPEIK